ncbi:hypothetical protein [Nocardia sp. NPDC050710]|uniref:hypothetical protein n=1 Tax=Nocardia sp. NPDC050710 TaxID=3157220 RepID=UPI0033FD109E
MRPTPIALGYLRRDVSGVSQVWDETHIRSLAKRLGYDLLEIVVFSAKTDRPVPRLIDAARTVDLDAVIVPSTAHFDGGEIPQELINTCDVLTVNPETTHARNSAPQIFAGDTR